MHLVVKDVALQKSAEHDVFSDPSNRYCPAGVYERVEKAVDARRFHLNTQNCAHCTTCDFKDPNRNITWTAPEGGDGPKYSIV